MQAIKIANRQRTTLMAGVQIMESSYQAHRASGALAKTPDYNEVTGGVMNSDRI